MGIYTVGIVGERHYQQSIARLAEGERVHLRHEPGNRHDANAIAVLTTSGDPIGYLPRGSWLADIVVKRRKPVSAIILAITGGEPCKPSRGVVLEVSTGEDLPATVAPPRAGGCAMAILLVLLPIAGLQIG